MYPGHFAASTPDKPALVLAETGETRTYAELEERSVRLAHALREHGLRPGDGVALVSPNDLTYYDVYWAALRSGFYVTPLNHHLSVEEQLYVIDDCGAKVLIVAAEMGEVAEQLRDRAERELPHVRWLLAFGARIDGYGSYEDTLAAASTAPLEDQPAGADMLYSSGTTGRPKGVRPALPARQVNEPGDLMLSVFAPYYGFDADTVYLSPAPLYHAAPLRFCGMVTASGGTAVIMRRFDPERALALLQEHRATHSQWVPTMFVRMLKLPDEVRASYDVSSMRVAIHAAAPCPVEVKQRMLDWWGPVIHEYYSATEAPGITLVGPEDWLTHPGTVGRSALGVLHVCDEATEEQAELPVGEIGLVYFERDEMPFAYHHDAEKTRQAQHPAHPNWATTGDVGRVDEEGFLYLTDRRAFMIISGGVNIYPQEIENALALHPAVLDVAVIGVPDEEMGEAVKAVVQPAPGVTPGHELGQELIAHVRGRLARFKAPRSVDFVDSLPRTPTGKLLKREVRARYLATATTAATAATAPVTQETR